MKPADNFDLRKFITEGRLLKESANEDYLNFLLDKIFEKGIDSLNPEEEKYLNSISKGNNAKTPDEYLQDLFKEWKDGEVEAGNDIDNIYYWSDLHSFDQELQDAFLSYVNLVKNYPNLNKVDLALLNSLGHQKEFNGSLIYNSYSKFDWDSLDEKTYNKILFDEFGIEPYEEDNDNPDDYDEKGNMKLDAYVKEFGHSFKELENWREILDQVKEKYNFNSFDAVSLKNFPKIEAEAKSIYIKKYGSPKYKKYPFSF